MPCLPPPHRHYIDRCIMLRYRPKPEPAVLGANPDSVTSTLCALPIFIPQYHQSNASLINTYLPISQRIEGRVTGRGVVAFSIRLYQNSTTASFWKTTL